jgi:Fe-S cluster assembly protein SufD
MFEIEETMKKDITRTVLANSLEKFQNLALDEYKKLETPSRVNHLWKYTDPLQFEMDLSNGNGKQGLPFDAEYKTLEDSAFDVEVSVSGNGKFELSLSYNAKSQGVILKSLCDSFEENSQLMDKYFQSLIHLGYGKYETLNLYKLQAGMVVYIPDNITLEKPIHIKRQSGQNWLFTRLLFITGDNVNVTVIDEYKDSKVENSAINSVIEVIAGSRSVINFATIQELQHEDKIFLTQRNSLGKDSQLQNVTISLGGGVSKYNWKTYLDGQGAESRWYGMLYGSNNQHFDHHTSQHHRAGNTSSNMDFKVAVQDEAVSAYTGKIIIDEGSVNCEAFQENRNLLLDDTAKVESIPELEISNDDVRCSHGVTVGPLEQDQIFYLMSRGIDREEALIIILNGFFEAIYKKLPVESLKNETEELLLAVMEG